MTKNLDIIKECPDKEFVGAFYDNELSSETSCKYIKNR